MTDQVLPMCRYGAPGGSNWVTLCARIRSAEVERGSADLFGYLARIAARTDSIESG